MNLRRIAIGALMGPGLFLLGCLSAQAGPVLNYVGNNFSFAIPTYTTDNRVMATIELASALENSVTDFAASAVSYSLSDGIQTLTEANSTVSSFFVSTNAVGAIIGWDLRVDSAATDGYIQTCGASSCFGLVGLTGDFGISELTGTVVSSLDCPASIVTMNGGPGAGNVCSPGTWSAREATLIPEPSSAALVMTALGMLVPLARRKASVRLS